MKNEMQYTWYELMGDLATKEFLWQFMILFAAIMFAWSINGLLRNYVLKNAPESWKVGISGINRILFPLTSLLLIAISKLIIQRWHHTSLLKLSITLLFAMVLIRLAVYALRFIFKPSSLLRTMENAIATAIWILFALDLSGLLPEILDSLESISFMIGKTEFNLLILIQAILTVVITMFIALWISRLIENKIMATEQINKNMRVVLSKILRIALMFVAILMSLSAVGLDITFLSVFGGAIGVGIGFGLQKIASNYISGFIILVDESMQLGDVVTVETHYGVVSDMRSRYMVLKKLDGTEVVIPNETLITNLVINHSSNNRKAKVVIPMSISYESDLELAMSLMKDIAKVHKRVISDPETVVIINNFAESGIELYLNVWIADPEEGSANLKSEIYLEIWKSFKANQITIPYPQREVRLIETANNK